MITPKITKNNTVYIVEKIEVINELRLTLEVEKEIGDCARDEYITVFNLERMRLVFSEFGVLMVRPMSHIAAGGKITLIVSGK
ncbi:MAG: hypothetical protein AAB874_01675 [Patescibacteria group bacterium]